MNVFCNLVVVLANLGPGTAGWLVGWRDGGLVGWWGGGRDGGDGMQAGGSNRNGKFSFGLFTQKE